MGKRMEQPSGEPKAAPMAWSREWLRGSRWGSHWAVQREQLTETRSGRLKELLKARLSAGLLEQRSVEYWAPMRVQGRLRPKLVRQRAQHLVLLKELAWGLLKVSQTE